MDDQVITLKSAVEAYLKHLTETGTKEATINVYRRALDLAITHFGADKQLTSILVPHVSKFFDSEILNKHKDGKPKAEPTVKQNKRVFRQCLEFAKSQGWISVLQIPKSELLHARSKTSSEPEKTEAAVPQN